MSLVRSGGYGHRVRRCADDEYVISWSWDTKIKGSRLRWPRTMSRFTDEAGARRFAKKWGLDMPAAARSLERMR